MYSFHVQPLKVLLHGALVGIPSYGIDFGGFEDWEDLNMAITIEIFAPFIQSAIGG
jgi:hypothetical protein